MPRDLAACLSVVQALQSAGTSWMSSLKSRSSLMQSMLYYMTRTGLCVDTLPHIIHIAGTKGKGSTAAMTESILRNAGLKTGLYTSPHLISLCERYRINGKPVETDVFLHEFWRTWDVLTTTTPSIACPDLVRRFAEASHDATVAEYSATPVPDVVKSMPMLPGFNFLTLVGFHIFAKADIDVLVCEVGLGGRLDATNVIERPAVCGITTLDFDHVELLGHTLREIAAEKAGIFKPGVPAVTVPQRADAMDALALAAAECGTPLFRVDSDLLARRTADGAFPALGLDGGFQRTNAALAVALADIYMHQLRSGRLASLKSDRSDNALKRHFPIAADRTSKHARRTSFSDSFGASKLAPLGETGLPLPVYDFADPLPAHVLEGLRQAQWPGRTQVVRLDPKSLKAVEVGVTPTGGALQLYLDGAHTQHSMLGACKWFVEHMQESDRSRPQKVILVFNCGSDKDAMQLLLPLSTIPFDQVFFTTVPWILTTRSSSITTADALRSFLRRKQLMEDEASLADVEEGARLAGTTLEALLEETPAPTSVPEKLVWQHTLRNLYASVSARPEYVVLRRRLAEEVGSNVLIAPGSSPSPRGASAIQEPAFNPDSTIKPSINEVLKAVQSSFLAEPVDTDYHVFVTGSLYLVGHTLETVGYAMDITA